MVQGAAAVSFQGIQQKLWFAGGCCHEVHMIGPNVSSKQGPPAARTNLLQAPQYQFPARRIQDVGLLAHSVSCSLFLAGVSFWQRGAICILSHRNGSSLAGEPSPVANKCNEVSRRLHRSLDGRATSRGSVLAGSSQHEYTLRSETLTFVDTFWCAHFHVAHLSLESIVRL